MDYELALELKNAGFPQDLENQSCRCAFKEERVAPETETFSHHIHEAVYVPTLSELISECGYTMTYLWRGSDENDERCWHAGNFSLNGSGATPEIAVAKLWLALHTNTHQ